MRTTLTKIPVLPISYGDAQPLLAAMTGPLAPADWRGGAADHLSLRPGPGARVHLKVAFNWDHEAALRRHRPDCADRRIPDEWIVRGNHHDAWVNGAEDPVSGMAAMLEEARALGELRQAGLDGRSGRIVYCGWDGEEPGCSDRPSGSSSTTTELQQQGGRLHQLATATAAAFSRPAARIRSSTSSTTSRATSRIPRRSVSVWKRRAGAARSPTRQPRGRARGAQPRRPADRRARIGLRLHAVPAAPRHRRR